MGRHSIYHPEAGGLGTRLTISYMKIFDKEYAKYEYEYEYLLECRKDLMARLNSIHRAIIEDQKSRIYPEK